MPDRPIRSDRDEGSEDDGARTELQRRTAERTRFLAVARHKLKTPMAVMAGWAATLDKWDLLTEDERGEGVRAIQRATGELQHQIEDLLDEARMQLLRDSMHPVPLELASFLVDLVAELQIDEDVHPTTVDADGDVVVLADPEALRHVVVHLLDNARTYSPDGGPIHVSARPGSPVVLEIRDHGIGLGDDVDVFAPFERAGNARSTARGTGLGLHIVRTLVSDMGGSVSAVAADEGGTIVRVELPTPDPPAGRVEIVS